MKSFGDDLLDSMFGDDAVDELIGSSTAAEAHRRTARDVLPERVREFTPGALLRLLEHIGYDLEQIEFTSDVGHVSPRSLVSNIECGDVESGFVRIGTAIGLLGPQSPLPSYFFSEIDSASIDRDAFVDFLGLFDHTVIKGLMLAALPEANRGLFPRLNQSRRRYLYLTNLRAPAGLHWLLSRVFPEITVEVTKRAMSREVRAAPLRLGSTQLGEEAVFGAVAATPVDGAHVVLKAQDEVADDGITTWPVLARERLESTVFPILGEIGADLEIELEIRNRSTHARLQQQSYLGYDPIVSDGADQAQRLLLFRGLVLNQSTDDDSKPPG